MIRITQAMLNYAASIKSDIQVTQVSGLYLAEVASETRVTKGQLLYLAETNGQIRATESQVLYLYKEIAPINMTQAELLVLFLEAPPVFTSPGTHEARTWIATTYTVTVSDPTDVTFSLEGTVPAGVSISGNVVTFTAMPDADFSLTIRAQRHTVAFAELILAVTVNAAPTFLAPPTVTGETGDPISFQVEALDPEAEAITFVEVGGTGETQLSITGQSGPTGTNSYLATVEGAFGAAGVYTFIVQADTANGGTAQQTVTITITQGAEVPNPVITILGANPVSVLQYTGYVDAGATADWNGTDITAQMVVEGLALVDTATLLSYTIYYVLPETAQYPEIRVSRTVLITPAVVLDCMGVKTRELIDSDGIIQPIIGGITAEYIEPCVLTNLIENITVY